MRSSTSRQRRRTVFAGCPAAIRMAPPRCDAAGVIFDLTFVVAFGIAASEFAHALAEDHVGAGLARFAFATFAIWWAWMNFSWFASAYDTDDWIYRLMTMLQMVGVIILALGLPQMRVDRTRRPHRHHHGGRICGDADCVGGPMVTRGETGSGSPLGVPYLCRGRHRRADRLDRADAGASVVVTFALTVLLVGVETMGPWLAETRAARRGTPAASSNAMGCWRSSPSVKAWSAPSLRSRRVIRAQGWTMDAVLVAVAGTGLTFGMWWVYFVCQAADLLHAHRERSSSTATCTTW